MSAPPITTDHGLYAVTEPDGTRWVTNLTRKLSRKGGDLKPAPGHRLVSTAAILLAVLDLGLFAVSFAAQNQYIYHAKHQAWPALTEAAALDAGMTIFSLLALGLARGGQSARTERALILLCALGSAAMNYAAADVTSARSVAAYVMPPVFLAIVTDRVIAVIRRHVLGMEAERSAWAAAGRGALAVLAGAGKALLYGVRLVLAPRSTFGGARTLVLLATPLPGAHVLVAERARLDAARTALGTVRAEISGDLRELAGRHELAAAALDGTVRTEIKAVRETLRAEAGAVRDAVSPLRQALSDDLRAQYQQAEESLDTLVRAEIGAVRETLRAEAGAMRDTVRTEAAAAGAAAGTLRAQISEDLRDLRASYQMTSANTAHNLRVLQDALSAETKAVRDAVRTEAGAVRDAISAQAEAVREVASTEAPADGEASPGAHDPAAPAPGITPAAHDPAAPASGITPAAHDPAASAPGDGEAVPTAAPAAGSVPALSFRPAPQEPGASLLLLGKAEIHFADMLADRKVPSQRQVMAELHVGTLRAREVCKHLAALRAGRELPGDAGRETGAGNDTPEEAS